jgi:hypothetical protein
MMHMWYVPVACMYYFSQYNYLILHFCVIIRAFSNVTLSYNIALVGSDSPYELSPV